MATSKTIWTGLIGKLGADHFADSGRKRREADFLMLVGDAVGADEQVLDLGAGSGFLTLHVAERLTSGRVFAIDLSKDMLARLDEQTSERHLEGIIEIRCTDAAATGLPDDSVGLVVSLGLLHELPDPSVVLRETYRVLRYGGRVLIKDYRPGLLLSPVMRLIHPRGASGPLAPQTLREALEHVGFRDVEVIPDGRTHLVAKGSK
jgi:ubiquinone/menaquinone biosynthesis C-methylase UbiE